MNRKVPLIIDERSIPARNFNYKFEMMMTNENLVYIGDLNPSLNDPQLALATAAAF